MLLTTTNRAVGSFLPVFSFPNKVRRDEPFIFSGSPCEKRYVRNMKDPETSVQICFCDASRNAKVSELSRSLSRLDEIKELPQNWNGNEANRFDEDFLFLIRAVVENLDRQPLIFPTARDSVQFEYENDKGDYLEFEIFTSNVIKMFAYDHTGRATTKEVESKDLNKEIMKFYE